MSCNNNKKADITLNKTINNPTMLYRTMHDAICEIKSEFIEYITIPIDNNYACI